MRGWQAAFRGLFPDAYLDTLDPRDRDSAFAERVTSGPPHHTSVAVEDNEVVGFVGLEPPESKDLDSASVHEIWGLYIEPQRFGRGIGRLLLDHATDRMQAGDWEYAILWTLRDVERTCRFYEAAGWYRDGEQDVWEIPEGNHVDLVRYRFDLKTTRDR